MRRRAVRHLLATSTAGALLTYLCAGCVVGAPRPAARGDVARAPAAPGGEDDAALPSSGGCSAPPETARPPPPSPGARWVSGYCHWEVTHHVWMKGHWVEPR